MLRVEWPAERELRAARAALAGGAGGHWQLPAGGAYPQQVGGATAGYGNPGVSGPPAYGSGYGYPPATSATQPLRSNPVFGRPDPERPAT